MWKLALRNVFRHKGRNIMTLLAIVVGVVGLILSGGFVHDIFRQLGETLIHSQSGHLQVSRQGYFDRGSQNPEKYLIGDTDRLRKTLAAFSGVEEVMGRLYFSGLLNNGRTDLPIVASGIEPEPEARLGSSIRLAAGQQLASGDEHGILVGHGLARALKLKPGDWTTLIVNTPDGALNSFEFKVAGIFQTFSKDYDARAVRIPLAAAQELMTTAGINTLVVSLKNTQDTDAVAAELLKRLPSDSLEVKTWVELNDFYAKTVEMYDAQFGVFRLIILAMVLLSVTNSVNMSVFERVGEFGTMQALGNRPGDILRLVMIENTILGLIGAIAGTLIGVGLALGISAVGIAMPPPPNSDLGYTAHILIVPSVLAGAFAVALVATVLAALLPAVKVSRIPVVDALRQAV